MKTDPLIVETLIAAPVKIAWESITKKEKMKEWYFDIPGFTPEEGYEFQFYGGTEEKKYLHLCRITEVKQQRKISYTWRYEGFPGDTLVTFELFPQNEATKIRLTHEGTETFSSDNPDFARERFAEGWDYIINTALKKYLANEAEKQGM